MFASYAAVANDSIQTIGTFIASNKNALGGCFGFLLQVSLFVQQHILGLCIVAMLPMQG